MLTPREYLDNGFKIAPVRKGEQYPPFENWTNREFKASEFKSHHGIAIVCGRPENNPIVDIDLDIPEAVRLAPLLLPNTGCIFGRLTNPKSHYLYRANGPTKKWKQNKIGCIAEIRGLKAITVAPPSPHHKTGEDREWDICLPKQIQVIGYDELVDKINTLASCAMLASLWPTAGMRHDYALGVGGWLAKELDIPTDDVRRIMKKMMQFVKDEEHDDRIRAAVESAESHFAGKKISAFNTLEPIIGKAHAITLRRWSKRPTLSGGSSSNSSNDVRTESNEGNPIRGTGEGVVDALDRLEVEIRCNVRTMSNEFRILNSELKKKLSNPTSEEWIEDSDDLQAVLRVTTESQLVFASGKKITHAYFNKMKWDEGLMFARSENMIDPFKMWLEKCKPWDNKSRIWEVPTTIWNLRYPEEEEYSGWAFASRLIAAVDRTYNPGAIADEMIVLQSNEEGILKSTSIGLMFPPDLKTQRMRTAWLHEGLRLDAFDPRAPLESIGQAVFVEASEMQGSRKADVDKLKSWLSQRFDQHRFAYGKVARHLPRRFIVFGTSNPVDCLPADMGDGRRYLPIALKRGMNGAQAREWFDGNREQLWAEALSHYRDGCTHYLPDSGTIREQHGWAVSRHRGGAVMADYVAEQVLDKCYEPSYDVVYSDSKGREYIKSSDLLRTAFNAVGLKPGEMHNVYKGLKLKNWSPGTTRDSKGKVVRGWIKEK